RDQARPSHHKIADFKLECFIRLRCQQVRNTAMAELRGSKGQLTYLRTARRCHKKKASTTRRAEERTNTCANQSIICA
ncbi:MAG: hypothetical protein SGPRY_003186, partial [Prymnesium sp.]